MRSGWAVEALVSLLVSGLKRPMLLKDVRIERIARGEHDGDGESTSSTSQMLAGIQAMNEHDIVFRDVHPNLRDGTYIWIEAVADRNR